MYFVTFILKNLTRRPTRTALTVLGLSVSVGSMIVLLGISENFRESMRDTFEKRGVDLVGVASGAADQLSSEVDESVVDAVRGMPEVAGVDAALVDLSEMTLREPRDESDTPPSLQVLVQAWLPENFGYSDLDILSGRSLTPADAGQYLCMVGYKFAENNDKKVGDTIAILRHKFTIVGVFKSFNLYENGCIITNLKEYQDLSGRKRKVTGFSLRVNKTSPDPDADVEAVRQKILALRDAEGKPYRVAVERPEKYLNNSAHLRIAKAMAWVVSLVALLIGVISMMNTMAMAVLERTQEIGILRAVGWPRGRVVRMVLGEAILLGVAAAVVGAVGAVVTTHLLALSPKVNGFIEGGVAPSVVAQGFAITVAIGLLGGAYPALRAARLLPTEAIRHD
ncbi:ABC transporter permease [Gemmata sp.]|uniref:ABC transporter permease n=1 Tax=Gemmata sp. TaxID=1914242 RepID=UPI003F71559A